MNPKPTSVRLLAAVGLTIFGLGIRHGLMPLGEQAAWLGMGMFSGGSKGGMKVGGLKDP